MVTNMFSSVATRVTLSLVITVTVVLAIGGSILFRYYVQNQQALFEERLELNANQLGAGIALAAWNIDDQQMRRVIKSAMQDKSIYSVVLETAGSRYAFSRDNNWEVIETTLPIVNVKDLMKAERDIVVQGTNIGHFELFVTTKFLHENLKHWIALMIISIAVLDLFLVVVLYTLLWLAVLKPLKQMERYAISIKSDRLSDAGEIRSPLVGEFGNVYETMASMVTQLKSRIAEISEINERFWSLVRGFPIPLSIYTPENGEIVLVNKRFTETYGYTERDIPSIGAWFEKAYPDPSYRQQVIDSWSAQTTEAQDPGRVVKSREYQVVCKDRGLKTVEIGGVISGKFVLGILVDVTDRRVAEQEVQNYQLLLEDLVEQRTNELVIARDNAESANRAKSIFLANMSHELRTPLNSVIGFSRLMGQDGELDVQQKRYLDIINRSGSHLLMLINDILDFSKIESGKMELSIRPMDLQQLVNDVVDMLRHRAEQLGIEVNVECSGLPQSVKADSGKLRQVLINLLSNAIKFTPQGKVELLAKGELNKDNVSVVFVVKDSGIGIEEEDQIRIFEPFVQVENPNAQSGTGLGLVISRQYVQMMGGELKLNSKVGEGSTFSFRLHFPLVTKEELQESNIERKALKFSGCRVLIADDMPEIRLLVRRLLEPMSFEIVEAEDGEQAREKILEDKPQLVLLDWRMPGIGGLELVKELRARDDIDQPVIIMMTGNTLEEHRQRAFEEGVDDLLSKPIEFEKLTAFMKRYASEYLDNSASEADSRSDLSLTNTQFSQPVLLNTLQQNDVEKLSGDIRGQFEEALRELNPVKMEEAIQAIRSESVDLADKLETYTESMRYRELWNMFGIVT